MKELTSQEMAAHDGGRLICIILGIAMVAAAASIVGDAFAGIAALASATAEFIDQGCGGGD